MSKDANILLDQWNEKQIEILRNKFQDCLLKEKKSKLNALDKLAFLKVFPTLNEF